MANELGTFRSIPADFQNEINDIEGHLRFDLNTDPFSRRMLQYWFEALEDMNNTVVSTRVAKQATGAARFNVISESFDMRDEVTMDISGAEPLVEVVSASGLVTTAATLPSGSRMPLLGLGTWKIEGEVCERAVYSALSAGYRSIDTAEAYGNEE